MQAQDYLWWVFGITVAGFLIVDLGYLNRRPHRIGLKSATLQSLFWIAASLAFAFLVFLYIGRDTAVDFLSAYVTEKMLSVDNLFVFALIFSYFKLEEKFHHRVLFWGILGAVILRGIFIATGSLIISQFHWVLYVFGVILVITGVKLLRDKKDQHADFHNGKVARLARKFLPFTTGHHGGKFLVRENSSWRFTVLFLILLLVETTDVVFAMDSIPAAFAISQNFFVVFTSNIFAVMGLRALFFLLEGVLDRFHHLQKALSFILIFIGVKMLLGLFNLHLSSIVAFAVIMGALIVSLLLSVLFPKKI